VRRQARRADRRPGRLDARVRPRAVPDLAADGDNCNVRDEVLSADGTKVKTSGCNVVAGTWFSTYDGKILDAPAKVEIDHLVPLANAWRSGAVTWTDARREDFANDLDRPELVAVSTAANRAKGDQDPSSWRPQRTGAWCDYASDWIAVKAHWKLTVTAGGEGRARRDAGVVLMAGPLTTDITAGPGGVMTDEAGVITGELTVRTEYADGRVTVRVQYRDAAEWYAVTGATAPLADEVDMKQFTPLWSDCSTGRRGRRHHRLRTAGDVLVVGHREVAGR
jgi:hypothetical protein